MIKNLTCIEHLIGEKVFSFFVDPTSTLGELHDALSAMKAIIISKMQEMEKQAVAPTPAPAQTAGVTNDVAQ